MKKTGTPVDMRAEREYRDGESYRLYVIWNFSKVVTL